MRVPRQMIDVRTLLALGLAVSLSACGDTDPLGVDQGRVRFVLSAPTTVTAADGITAAAPSLSGDDDEYERWGHRLFMTANVTFSSVLARNLDGVLVDVDMELPATVDVVSMDDGRRIVLPDGELPPGSYDQLVVVMTALQGVLRDGTTITIEPPGGGWTAIVRECPFTVEDGGTTIVSLQFMLREAFRWGDGRFRFFPRFRCVQEPAG